MRIQIIHNTSGSSDTMYKDVLDLFFFKLFYNIISETTVLRDDDTSLCWLTAFFLL